MARVVQRRSAPPYLLIVFVMLFLASATLAGIFYNRASKARQAEQDATGKLNKATDELSEARNEQIPSMALQMTGRRTTAAVALDQAKQLFQEDIAKPYANAGLIDAVRGLGEKLDAARKQVTELEAEVRANKDSLDETNRNVRKLGSEYQRLQTDAANKVKALQQKVESIENDKKAQIQQVVAEKGKIIEELNKRITLQAQEIEDLKGKIRDLEGQVAYWRNEATKHKPTGRAADLLAKADGKIVKVIPEQQLCYISLGRREGVRRGLPFSVYSARTGVGEKGEGKAKIAVLTVGGTTSECRIVESTATDPVVEGDLIANVAFDTARVHKFVVEGEFDLYGTGRPDPLANSRIRKMIERWGGQVVDEVTVDTDFVVMGAEPAAPPKPATDAPPQEWELYRHEMKKYQRYRDVRGAARRFHVRILNTARFLAYSGLAPKSDIVQ